MDSIRVLSAQYADEEFRRCKIPLYGRSILVTNCEGFRSAGSCKPTEVSMVDDLLICPSLMAYQIPTPYSLGNVYQRPLRMGIWRCLEH